jgi:hypothetical protein
VRPVSAVNAKHLNTNATHSVADSLRQTAGTYFGRFRIEQSDEILKLKKRN